MANCRYVALAIALFTAAPVWSLDFIYQYVDNTHGDFAARGWLNNNSDFQRNVRAAAEEWARKIDANTTLVIEVSADRDILRAGGTFSLGALVGQDGSGRNVFEPGPLTKIRTGSNPGGAIDIFLTFNPQFVDDHYWIDPTPENLTDSPPLGRTDLVSIAMHELGHALGVAGFRSFSADTLGELAGSNITSYDELTFYGGNGEPRASGGELNDIFFAGESASALFGGPVVLAFLELSEPLASQNFYHLGTCSDPLILLDSLMNGCRAPVDGSRWTITPIDLAIFTDLGYPTTASSDNRIFADGFEPTP